MGVISIEQKDRLYWLGRYTERVYTTIRIFFKNYDEMIDSEEEYYQEICKKIEIPDIYGSKKAFLDRYLNDETDINSIISNLLRAHDNAIVLREEIGTETLSYIEMAIFEMRKLKDVKDAPLVILQKVIDYIMAFWGMMDDLIGNEEIRNIIKYGKRVERVDLYARFAFNALRIQKEVVRLMHRIGTTGMEYDYEKAKRLLEESQKEYPAYQAIIYLVESL